MEENKHGYHISTIERGEFGELSKIKEEIEEAIDAEKQNCKIMVLIELSDLYGAMSGYLEKHYPNMSMADLAKMSEVTHRAFLNGFRND